MATFLIFFLHFYLIIGTYFSHFRGTWWFLWSIKILCSPQVVLSNRGLHFVKILWLIYRKTIINIPQNTIFSKNVGYVATHGHISKIWLIIGLIQGNKYYVTQLTLDITAQMHGYWVIFLSPEITQIPLVRARGTYFSHFWDMLWFLWSNMILCSHQVLHCDW